MKRSKPELYTLDTLLYSKFKDNCGDGSNRMVQLWRLKQRIHQVGFPNRFTMLLCVAKSIWTFFLM